MPKTFNTFYGLKDLKINYTYESRTSFTNLVQKAIRLVNGLSCEFQGMLIEKCLQC